MFVKMHWTMPSASGIASEYRSRSPWLKQLNATRSRSRNFILSNGMKRAVPDSVRHFSCARTVGWAAHTYLHE
jgi:hypothetical protein